MKIKKVISASAILLSSAMLMSACGNKATQSVGQQQARNANQQKTVKLDFWHGDLAQSQGIITMPVVINNAGTNDTVISSQNFTLTIDGHKFKTFQVEGEPSDFHDNLQANGTWSNLISFYLGTNLTKKQLKKVQLEYDADNGSVVHSQFLSSSDAPAKVQSVTKSGTSLADYYAKATDYIKQAKNSIKSGNKPNSLTSQFQDGKYDQFRFWVLGSSKYPDVAIFKAINNTNTDLYLPLANIQFEDKDKNDIQVHPTYRSYTILIPHGKSIDLGIPLESNLKASETPYQVQFRSSNGGNNAAFTSTSGSFNPAEFVFNNSADFAKAFMITPDQYPKQSISWKNSKIEHNSLTVDVKLYDYFYINSDKSKYALVGLNNDGTVGDTEKALSVDPTKITGTGSSMTFKFDDLSVIKTYKKIALQYNGKNLFRIK